MAIIVSKNGGKAKKVEETRFRDENTLQAYIKKHPEVIPVDELADETKVFIAVREYPTNSGPIDALGFDRLGNIYIIETKLYKNSDKRKVLAQVLDYGASLWKHGGDFTQFLSTINEEIKGTFKATFEEKLTSFFCMDENEVSGVIEAINENLSKASFKFLIVMDQLDERLKDLILFLNTNSQFDVYAVELEYYKVEDYEIIIPQLFGNEVKKTVTSTGQSGRKVWSKDIFFEEAKNSLSAENVSKLEKFYEFGEMHNLNIVFGTGSVRGSFAPRIEGVKGKDVSLFHVKTDGTVELISWYWKKYFETIKLGPEIIERIKDKINIPVDDSNNCTNITQISDEDIKKLFVIYKDVIKRIEETELTEDPDY